jgi:hypothetical protein
MAFLTDFWLLTVFYSGLFERKISQCFSMLQCASTNDD